MNVSAYVPCYNARKTIREAVQSIADQTVPLGEIFVVDDGSTDGSGDISEVTVIRSSSNAGRGAARARAMVEAKHEIVLGCDATIKLDRHFLKNALPWFTNNRVAAVFGSIKEGAKPTVANRWRGRHLFQSELTHEVAHRASLATHCCVVRKSAAQQVGGFNAALRAGEDADLGMRLLRAGFDVVFDPKLVATSVLSNSVIEVLERYARWNTLTRMTLCGYLRQLSYSLKVMVAKDLTAKDPLSGFISLLAPHYQFWGGVVSHIAMRLKADDRSRLFHSFKEMNLLRSLAKRVINYDRRQECRQAIRRWRHFGFAHYCPCCKAHLRSFVPFSLDPDPKARCPVCGSMQRHRLIWLYMNRKTDLFDGRQKRMLHIAPEPQLARLFQKADYVDYLSADLFSADAMIKMDITDIQYPASTFDVIYCSHVLEHVPDDSKAMREFHRVLKSGGWAILQVPITADTTFEDATVNSDEQRTQFFGQHDHVRRYGPDYKDRLLNAGFSVTVDAFVRGMDNGNTTRFGLMRNEDVYFCRKEPKLGRHFLDI
jgi:GT2 family glycosyltransferase/SAM-dependent methyltransferase